MAQWKVLGVASCNPNVVGSGHISNHKKRSRIDGPQMVQIGLEDDDDRTSTKIKMFI